MKVKTKIKVTVKGETAEKLIMLAARLGISVKELVEESIEDSIDISEACLSDFNSFNRYFYDDEDDDDSDIEEADEGDEESAEEDSEENSTDC